MPDRLREFIYLDDISVNSHLSSLGEGKPEEIVDISEESTETEGGGSIQIASGSHSRGHLSSTETQMSATAPYRYEQLLSKLNEEEIPIGENPAPEAVSRGDIVRIDGIFKPMSLYKIEIAVTSLLNLIDEETAQSVTEKGLADDESESDTPDMEEIPGSRESQDDSTDQEAIEAMYELGEVFRGLAEELIGDSVPVRIDYDGGSAVSLLDRDKFDKSHMEAFFEQKEYTIFGRVDERISRNDEWDPIRASNVMGRYFEDQGSEQWRDEWEEAAEGMGISMDSNELTISGRSLVVYPIAVYW